MDASVGMPDAEFGVERAGLPRRFGGGAQLRCVIDEDGAFPSGKQWPTIIGIEAEELRERRRRFPRVCRQVPFEPAASAGRLGDAEPLLRLPQLVFKSLRIRASIAHRCGARNYAAPLRIALA